MIRKFLVAVTFVSLLPFSRAQAQQTSGDEPLLDALVQAFRTRALRINVFLQILGDYQPERDGTEGNSGFSIPRARIALRGELDGGFSYSLEADLARSPAVNDAWVRKTFSPAFAIDMGQFKTPFSAERLQSTTTMEFIKRSQIVTAFAPGRQLGVMIRGQVPSTGVGYMLGAFNANSPRALSNDNNELMGAGRLSLHVDPFADGSASDGIDFGINAFRSRDEAVTLGYSFGSTFRGIRTASGADVRAERGPWLFSAEYIRAKLEDFDNGTTSRPFGWYGNISYSFAPKHRGHFRWDSIHADGRRTDHDLAVFGWSYQMTTPMRLMVNYVWPSGEVSRRHQLLTQMHFYF